MLDSPDDKNPKRRRKKDRAPADALDDDANDLGWGSTDTDAGAAGVRSVEIAAEILQALAANGGVLPLKALAQATAMPRGKVHRYLVSLKRARMVAQDPKSGHYRIGPAAISTGLAGLRSINPLRVISDALPELRDLVDETVTMAVWTEHGPAVVAMEETAKTININVRIGTMMPLLETAIGQCFAAFMPEALIRDVMARERARAAEEPIPNLPSPEQYDDLLAAIRTRGLARNTGTYLSGIEALAAPVFGHSGKLAAVLCVVGRTASLDHDWDGEPARKLTRTTAGLSADLGYAPGAPDAG